MPQVFRALPRGLKVIGAPKRSSSRSRGYDAKWDRRSAAYRRRNPLCVRCAEVDRVEFCAVVDHKYPVQDGGEVHCSDAGLWSLCATCHGWKQRLEEHARATGQLDQIVRWCDRPETRPTLRGEVRP